MEALLNCANVTTHRTYTDTGHQIYSENNFSNLAAGSWLAGLLWAASFRLQDEGEEEKEKGKQLSFSGVVVTVVEMKQSGLQISAPAR